MSSVRGVALLLVGLWLLVAVAAAAATELSAVQVRGNLRVEEGLILQAIESRAGDAYDSERVRQDIRAIYRLGYFEDIVVELSDAGVLTFVVLERPALREWRVTGVEELEEDDVTAEIVLPAREILDDAQVQAAVDKILLLYRDKGYYLAQVVPEIVPVAGGKNQVDLVLRVEEGEKVKLKEFNLLGAERIDEDELRGFLTTKEAGTWSFVTGSGKFTEPDLDRDREVIRSYYLNHGFVDVEVLDPLVSLTGDRRWIKVAIPIREGEEFRVGSIAFSGDLEFSTEELRAAVEMLEEGELFRSDDFRSAHQEITDRYADRGYAFVDVNPRTRIDREVRRVDVDFEIHKGPKVYIGRIEVRGNTKTHDRIIRRELRLSEGELYSGTALRKSRQQIEALGFFEGVSLSTPRRPGTDLVDVLIEVTEQPTGSFSLGAGYSSVDKIVGMINVSQRNFLGRGYQLSAAANLGSSRESYDLTFNNPRVFDSHVYAGVDLYKAARSYSTYDKDSVGGALKLGTSLNEDWKTRWIYRLEEADVKNVDDGASTLIREQEGVTVTSSLTSLLLYDTRDNPWEPHTGVDAQWSVEWAGSVLQGDAAFLKYGFQAARYFDLWWDTVFMTRGRIGFIHRIEERPIPIYERFTLGGINTLRGFDNRKVGPTRDRLTADDDGNLVVVGEDVVGGDKELLFNVEYLFPLVPAAKVRGLLFFDAGNAWDEGEQYWNSRLRHSAGLGVRWFSPMGPLRLEWGYVLDRKPGEDKSQWEFSIGGFF